MPTGYELGVGVGWVVVVVVVVVVGGSVVVVVGGSVVVVVCGEPEVVVVADDVVDGAPLDVTPLDVAVGSVVGDQGCQRPADPVNWLKLNVDVSVDSRLVRLDGSPWAKLDADASIVIIVTRTQDVTASVTILGKRCVVLPLRN